MKAFMIMMISCLSLFFSFYSFAGCGDGGCGLSDGYSYGYNSGSCSDNEYDNVCQCTDIACSGPDRGCLSKTECCEAFGNMGAR